MPEKYGFRHNIVKLYPYTLQLWVVIQIISSLPQYEDTMYKFSF